MSCNNPRCNYGKELVEEGAGLALCPECNADRAQAVEQLMKTVSSKEARELVMEEIKEQNEQYLNRLEQTE